jgi:hypothetical protein
MDPEVTDAMTRSFLGKEPPDVAERLTAEGEGLLSGGPDLLPRVRSSMRDVGVHGTSAHGLLDGQTWRRILAATFRK